MVMFIFSFEAIWSHLIDIIETSTFRRYVA
jgi:hypothetical protein